MKKQMMYLIIITIITLIWAACNRDHIVDADKPAPDLEYLSFTNHGCQGQGGLTKSLSTSSYLARHQVVGDTLILTIHHDANCCPAFIDSISLHENRVDISIDDTLRGCKCICQYENEFAFLNPGNGPFRVRFGWMGSPFELDTLIQL